MRTGISRPAFFVAGFVMVGAIFALWIFAVSPSHAQESKPAISKPLVTTTPTASPTCSPHWRVVASPNGSGGSMLHGMASLAVDNVWAAGASSIGGTSQTLIEHWNGTMWSTMPSPNQGTGPNVLYDVAADSPTNAWAVGSASGPLAMHWDGTMWSIVPTPDLGANARLSAASTISTTFAWAVGTFGPGSNETLILQWDGTSWTRSPSPAIGVGSVYLEDVDIISRTDVWAVGYETDGMGISIRTLALHWDGTSWTRAATPEPGFEQQFLEGVSTNGPNNVLAVGYYHDTGSNPEWRTLVVHWDGMTWQQMPSPNAGFDNFLSSVKFSPVGDVWAVGSYNATSGGMSAPLVEHYDGVAWSIVPSEAIAGVETGLLAVDICSTNHPKAVGWRGTGSNQLTLAEELTYDCAGPCPMNFSDVHSTDYFYQDVQCVYCMGAVSGYADGTFRPFSNTTRGQMSKMIVLGLRIATVTPTGTPTFIDVPATNPFYTYIETLVAHNIISGYSDHTFRPNTFITRGQLSKIAAVAANFVFGWPIPNPNTASFSDVPPGSPFYQYVETVACHGVISGYTDGTFKPGNNAVRAQIAKIVCRTAQDPPPCGSGTPTPMPTSMP